MSSSGGETSAVEQQRETASVVGGDSAKSRYVGKRKHPSMVLIWPALALVLVLLVNLKLNPGFFHVELKDGRLFGSLIDIVHRACPVMLTAIGMTLVIATGGVDLSVGAVMAITGAVAAQMLAHQYSCTSAVVISTFVGLIAGLWNGALVALLDIQPIVATLILMVAGRGIAQLLTGGQPVIIYNEPFKFLGSGDFAWLPFPITVVAATLIVFVVLTRRTALGLFIESVGNNPVASRYAGLPVRSIKLFVYGVCGLCSGIAGILATADIAASDANNTGLYLELDAILAVVIGGTLLIGGRFFLLGSILGALVIQSLLTTIKTRGIPAEYNLTVEGAVVLIVCLLQSPKFRAFILRRKS